MRCKWVLVSDGIVSICENTTFPQQAKVAQFLTDIDSFHVAVQSFFHCLIYYLELTR